MEVAEVTLAERGQVVIPKEARDALGLKPGARLAVLLEGGRILLEKRVKLDLDEWVGHAEDDGLSVNEVMAELRGRPYPHVAATVAPVPPQPILKNKRVRLAAPKAAKRRAA